MIPRARLGNTQEHEEGYSEGYCLTNWGQISPRLGSISKESTCSVEDPGLISGLGRFPREDNGNPLQYFCLENSITEEPGGLQSRGSQRVEHN